MNAKEVSTLVRLVEQAGGIVSRARNGHLRVVNPATGRSIQIASSPGNRRNMLNSRTRLRRIGIDVNDRPGGR